MPSRTRPWLFALAWAAVIFTFSTASFSDANTSRFFLPLYRFLMPHATYQQLEFMHYLTRKAAHIFEYFVFGWLLLIAVRGPERGWKLRWGLLALLIAALYGMSDEFHQIFIPGRTPAVRDVMLDTTGAAIAVLTAWLVLRSSQTGQDSSPRTS